MYSAPSVVWKWWNGDVTKFSDLPAKLQKEGDGPMYTDAIKAARAKVGDAVAELAQAEERADKWARDVSLKAADEARKAAYTKKETTKRQQVLNQGAEAARPGSVSREERTVAGQESFMDKGRRLLLGKGGRRTRKRRHKRKKRKTRRRRRRRRR
jgi:hypothetical protein